MKTHIKWLKPTRLLHITGGRFKTVVAAFLLLSTFASTSCYAFDDPKALLKKDAREPFKRLAVENQPIFHVTKKDFDDSKRGFYEDKCDWRPQSERFEYYEDKCDWKLQKESSGYYEGDVLLNINDISAFKFGNLYLLDLSPKIHTIDEERTEIIAKTVVDLPVDEKIIINAVRNLIFRCYNRSNEDDLPLLENVTLGRLVLVARSLKSGKLFFFKMELEKIFKELPILLEPYRGMKLEVLCKKILDKNFYY